uniref:BH4_AAA_HYDROXYL_2 domain-containing protein n=1 Tax=Steinernema glaseri TaxID=37863 RepID=A0A1I7YHP8_9BILA
MAAAMKFCYYAPKRQTRRTLSSSVSDNHIEEFKRRFRRSGSLGVPFFPEEDMNTLKRQLTIEEDEEEGQPIVTVIIKTSRSSDSLTKMLASIPVGARVKHMESRDSQHGSANHIEVLMELEMEGSLRPAEVVGELRRKGLKVDEINQTFNPKNAAQISDPGSNDAIAGCPWFPKSIYDLDLCAKKVIMYGSGLEADHPGFKDEEYRKRRMLFADIALNYKQGEPIPRIEYTEQEKKTWGIIYRKLRELHKKYACQEFLDNFELLEKHCGYSEHNIPQLEDICKFLKMKTGFRVRPVAGYLSARDFLAGLAFRVFNSTQYVRHHADPFYTPEPDTVHELMGHMALFADPDFAQFSQEIGLASLGASEEDLTKLATLYFFSIEFGLCSGGAEPHVDECGRPNYKIYGAGLLSSAGELQHAVGQDGHKPELLRFDPDRVVQQECLITTFQTAYFYTRNFEEAQQKLRMFTNSMNRPFVVRYNAYTESIEVLNNKRSLMLAVNSLRSDINLLSTALHNIL